MKIISYGHSCMGIETAGKKLLIDPFISANPKAAKIDVDAVPADYILLTHAHYDHLMDLETIAHRTGALLISNHEIVTRFAEKGIKGHAMNPGGSWNFDFGRLKMVTAVHSSSFPDGFYGGNPTGFVLQSGGKTIYLAGDTALTFDMKLIPMFFKLDLAVLPIGGNFTMDVEEAIVATDFLECNRVLGVHYNTVDTIIINQEKAINSFKEKGKELVLLDAGESIDV